MTHVHFVGIGGAGLSAIAQVLLESGYSVSGSDEQASPFAQGLAAAGARVYTGHAAAQVNGAEMVVISSAVPADNVEVQAARARGVPVLKRSDLLGRLMEAHVGIAVAGAHGKTTTTGLVAFMLDRAGLDRLHLRPLPRFHQSILESRKRKSRAVCFLRVAVGLVPFLEVRVQKAEVVENVGVVAGKLLHCGGFAATRAGWTYDSAGEAAVFHLETGAQDVTDAQVACSGPDLVGSCGRHDCDGVSFAQVGLHERPRLGIDRAREVLLIDLLTELRIALLGDSAQNPGTGRHRRQRARFRRTQVQAGRGSAFQLGQF